LPGQFLITLLQIRIESLFLVFSLVVKSAGEKWQEWAMYAVFEDGSRQYRVSEGQKVRLDYREAEPGTRLEFNRVLFYKGTDELKIGQPVVEGMRILAEVVSHPSVKLYIQHFRRRKNYRRLRGHRQPYTEVQIRNILLPGMEPPATPPASTSTEPAATPPLSDSSENPVPSKPENPGSTT
jgi:large subunit ribosomal protein L21